MKRNATATNNVAKAVVLGNGVFNKSEEAPLLLLPPAPKEESAKEEKLKEQPKVKVKNEPIPAEKAKKEVVNVSKRLSIDELTDKADRIYLLKKKYQEIREKRKQLESFTISHENDNAQLNLIDANGLSISTSNPVAIGKLLTDWMLDLNTHLAKTEGDIRTELEAAI